MSSASGLNGTLSDSIRMPFTDETYPDTDMVDQTFIPELDK